MKLELPGSARIAVQWALGLFPPFWGYRHLQPRQLLKQVLGIPTEILMLAWKKHFTDSVISSAHVLNTLSLQTFKTPSSLLACSSALSATCWHSQHNSKLNQTGKLQGATMEADKAPTLLFISKLLPNYPHQSAYHIVLITSTTLSSSNLLLYCPHQSSYHIVLIKAPVWLCPPHPPTTLTELLNLLVLEQFRNNTVSLFPNQYDISKPAWHPQALGFPDPCSLPPVHSQLVRLFTTSYSEHWWHLEGLCI